MICVHHHLLSAVGLCLLASFTYAHDSMRSVEDPRHRNVRRVTMEGDASSLDFTITCQTDQVLFHLDQIPSNIIRKCTIHSFVIFTEGLVLSCDSSSLAGVDCEVSPSYVMLSDAQPGDNVVQVVISTTDLALEEERGEILVTAVHGINERSSSIPVALVVDDPSDHLPSGSTAKDGDTDFFLLGGQSNMHGHTTSGQSIGGNGAYWRKIKSILDAGGDPASMESELSTIIHETQIAKNQDWPESVAITLANETMKLYNKGLLDNLDTPLGLGSCSFVIPQDSGGVQDWSGGTTPTVWDANCGGSFGHELTFSRTLEIDMGRQNSFEMVKNARGGTEIHRHWYPQYGMYWDQLRSSIASKIGLGNWKGFIWHQGTQEQWTEEDTSLTYLGNLTGLVDAVRTEMFDASQAGIWQCKEEIPVVVVQIGYWPQGERSQRVRDAQAKYCAEDPRAELVVTYDLSRFYHFDASSFLIGGYRIAEAYQTAIQTSVVCPSPTNSPTGTPTTSPCSDCGSLMTQTECSDCSSICFWGGMIKTCRTCSDCVGLTTEEMCNACSPTCFWSAMKRCKASS